MLSRVLLIKQGKCCGNGCIMCPYEKKHVKNSKVIKKEVINGLENWEKKELKDLLSYLSKK
jgi:hypothetical protein